MRAATNLNVNETGFCAVACILWRLYWVQLGAYVESLRVAWCFAELVKPSRSRITHKVTKPLATVTRTRKWFLKSVSAPLESRQFYGFDIILSSLYILFFIFSVFLFYHLLLWASWAIFSFFKLLPLVSFSDFWHNLNIINPSHIFSVYLDLHLTLLSF